MHIRGLCIVVVSVLSAMFPTAAFAQAPIGDAASVANDVQASLNRQPLPISTGGSVFQNEHLRTGDAGQATLVFLDNTDFSLGPTSRATLNRFIYNPDNGTGRVQIEADRGVFRVVTGKQDKKDYTFITPSGTIRVKGTEFQLLVEKSYIIVALESGALSVTTNKGRVVPLDQPGTSLTVHKDGRVEGPTPFSGTITRYANAQFPYFVSALPPAINLATTFTTFTGCYVGAQIGGSAGTSSFGNTYTNFAIESDRSLVAQSTGSQNSVKERGIAIGGLSGCRYQIGPVVIGAEAEYGYDGQSSSGGTFSGGPRLPPSFCNIENLNFCDPRHTLRQTFNITGVGRARAEVGYVVLPNVLLYVAGGWTLASTNTSLGGTDFFGEIPVSDSSNKVVNGANAGFGGEYAFTPFLIGRIEYIYDRITPHYNYSGFTSSSSIYASVSSFKSNVSTVRAALLFKF